MLWNPKYDKPKVTYDRRSLASLIAWLETKDPNEEYDYGDTRGGCVLGQFLKACGYKRVNCGGHSWGWDHYQKSEEMPDHFSGIAVMLGGQKRTFGEALNLARTFA